MDMPLGGVKSRLMGQNSGLLTSCQPVLRANLFSTGQLHSTPHLAHAYLQPSVSPTKWACINRLLCASLPVLAVVLWKQSQHWDTSLSSRAHIPVEERCTAPNSTVCKGSVQTANCECRDRKMWPTAWHKARFPWRCMLQRVWVFLFLTRRIGERE